MTDKIQYNKKEYRLNKLTVDNLSKLKSKTGLTYNKLFIELIKNYCMDKTLTKEQQEKLNKLTSVKIGDICPHCGIGTIELKYSKYGTFLGCSQFPRCTFKQNKIKYNI